MLWEFHDSSDHKGAVRWRMKISDWLLGIQICWYWDQQLGIRNIMISNSTNCLLYRVSGFSIPSWLTCWVCERPAALSDTFQGAEDLVATGVLTSSLQGKCVWTVLTTDKLLVFVCESWCSLINFLYFVGKLGETYIFMRKFISLWGNFIYMVGKLSIPTIWLLMTCTWLWETLLTCWGWLLLTNALKDLRIELNLEQTNNPTTLRWWW